MRRLWILLPLVLLALLLPGTETEPPAPPTGRAPFAWNRDAEWKRLEDHFTRARADCAATAARIETPRTELQNLLTRLETEVFAADAPELDRAEAALFEVAVARAACPADPEAALAWLARFRDAVKLQSTRWDLAQPAQRARLYRLLYGARAALEEALLQQPRRDVPPLALGRKVPSETPAVTVEGVELHSGDLLVSRGGAATSALIARGSDFAGNFSHVALLHVDAATREATVVEAHIELGVKPVPLATYLADKKLRILALRLREGVTADAHLPHRAATAALTRARAGHIAYDFAMDAADHGKLFCSEVAWAAYEGEGVKLWPGLSSISAPGTRRWLWSVGVRHFDTLEPSDLEYDPQLAAVAEWFDADALAKDHRDNAVTDVMLEEAERGATLPVPWWKLPAARVAKAWSALLVANGRVGPVPEGMSPEAALRSVGYTARHAELRARLDARADAFTREHGYPPPYWQLVALARP